MNESRFAAGLYLDNISQAYMALQGDAADGDAMQGLRDRIAKKPPLRNVMLASPTAGGAAFANFDWQQVTNLEIIDARIETDVVASWQIPNVTSVNLSECDVSIDVLPILLNKAPNLTAVRLKNVDPDARLPELPPLSSNLILDLAGRTIEVSDIEELIRARPKLVLLDRCQFSPEAIEKAKKHEATAESPVLVLQSSLV